MRPVTNGQRDVYPANPLLLHASPPLLLAYRDSAHLQLGRSYCERLIGLVNWQADPKVTEWKFEMLARRELGALAAAEARLARVIVFTTRCGEEWAPELAVWFRQCLASRQRCPGAMVVVLSSDADCPSGEAPDYSSLEAEAEAGGLLLVVYATGMPVERSTSFSFGGARRVTAKGLIAVSEPAEVLILEQAPAIAFR